MASIFSGAHVTLAALSSADGTQGCRVRPRDADQPKLARYHDFKFGSHPVRIFEHTPAYWHLEYGDNPYNHDGYGTNPLRTRAWTLQERELSIRSIHFSQGQLLWQCRTMKGSSELPWLELRREYDDTVPLPLRISADEPMTGKEGPEHQRNCWYGLVEDYSSRYMSHEVDKLPALAGLAFVFNAEGIHGTYFAGIWSNHLPSALLWRTVPTQFYHGKAPRPTSHLAAFQPRRPQVYRAPSWSWAAIDGEISYESQKIDGSEEPFDAGYGDFEITGSYHQLAAAFEPLGTPVNSSLRIRGALATVWTDKHPTDDSAATPWRLLDADGQIAGVLYPDVVDDFRAGRAVVALSMRSEPYRSLILRPLPFFAEEHSRSAMRTMDRKDLRMGLALQRAQAGEIYRRVGLVRWVRKEVFDDAQPAILRIV